MKENLIVAIVTALWLSLLSPAFATSGSQSTTLRYCVDPNWMPYEAIRNNVHIGISADYLRLLEEYSSFQFDLVATDSWTQSLSYIEEGKCDLLPMLNRTQGRERLLLFSETYFTASNVLVAPVGSTVVQGYEAITDQLVGVVEGYRQSEYLSRYYPHIEQRRFNNEAEVLQALADDTISLAVGSLLAVNALIQNNGLNNIQVVGLAQPHDQLRVGVARNLALTIGATTISAEQIVAEIDAAIAAIPESAHVNIYRQWNNVKYIEHTDYYFYAWPLAVLMMVIVGMVWRYRVVHQYTQTLAMKNQELECLQKALLEKNKSLEFLSIHDPLTTLYNRNFMLQRAEEAINTFERFKQPVSIIVMDVDHFKTINDRYGHGVGDRVLVELAQLAQRCLREVDLIARWGGEEFLIMCINSDEEAAKVLAQRITDALRKAPLASIQIPLTCSFGVAQLNEGEDFSTWFDNADRCMFSAKRNGRNQIIGYRDGL
ncbi:GGDEF domain-containing protein [Alteromonas flava]|uniref:transporter substrate-binding domain-containing diguanylate cyclase n=1 Tax=Alteromonas flava TaxID=2048003 RepID=UPI000C282773|nr:GGDEF domain-containing protein [Alteromonas flava]